MSIPKRASEMVIYEIDAPLQMIHPRPTAEELVDLHKTAFAEAGEFLLEDPYIVNVATGERIVGHIPEDVSVALVIIRLPRPPD